MSLRQRRGKSRLSQSDSETATSRSRSSHHLGQGSSTTAANRVFRRGETKGETIPGGTPHSTTGLQVDGLMLHCLTAFRSPMHVHNSSLPAMATVTVFCTS